MLCLNYLHGILYKLFKENDFNFKWFKLWNFLSKFSHCSQWVSFHLKQSTSPPLRWCLLNIFLDEYFNRVLSFMDFAAVCMQVDSFNISCIWMLFFTNTSPTSNDKKQEKSWEIERKSCNIFKYYVSNAWFSCDLLWSLFLCYVYIRMLKGFCYVK